MTVPDIIQHHLPSWRKTAKKLAYPSDLWEDLLQECCIVILTKPPDDIIGMHNRKELNWFMVRVMLNNWRGKKSPFAMKYRHLADESNTNLDHLTEDEPYDHELDIYDQRLHSLVMEELDRLPRYKKNLFLLYTYQNKSMRELSEETGIPQKTIHKIITNVRNHFNARPNQRRDNAQHPAQLKIAL